MRISPVFAKAVHSDKTTMGQAFQRTSCRKPTSYFENNNDVFVRLAEASMRDVKIESELKSMNLI